MATLSRYDAEIAGLGNRSGIISHYRSDHRVAFLGGRGGKDEEIAFLNAESAADTETHLQDSWAIYLSEGYGMTFGRIDEAKRRHFEENGSF